mgnify:CR=1 FL=1
MEKDILIYSIKKRLGIVPYVDIGRHMCKISYSYNDKNYIIRFKRNSRCNRLFKITHNDEDVTNKIITYMGVGYNFHGIPTTPNDLGYNTLTFHMIDDTQKTFSEVFL